MSEIITVYHLITEEATFIFDNLPNLIDVVKAEVEGCMCCIGDKIEFSVKQCEMEQSLFDRLKEFEG